MRATNPARSRIRREPKPDAWRSRGQSYKGYYGQSWKRGNWTLESVRALDNKKPANIDRYYGGMLKREPVKVVGGRFVIHKSPGEGRVYGVDYVIHDASDNRIFLASAAGFETEAMAENWAEAHLDPS